jgi:hypothetical protein
MDRLMALQAFARVVELGGFTTFSRRASIVWCATACSRTRAWSRDESAR